MSADRAAATPAEALVFVPAHATHPDWRMALALAAAQVEAQIVDLSAGRPTPWQPTLGLCYFSDIYASEADALWAELRQRWPGVAWAGAAAVALAASGVEYSDEPALVMMLGNLPAQSFQVFSGARPLQVDAAQGGEPRGEAAEAAEGAAGAGGLLEADTAAWTALVHADARAPELTELLHEMADRTGSGYLFGGLVASRTRPVQLADGVFSGGLSGVAFGREVALISRVTQGCQPVGAARRITAAQDNLVLRLDDEPALDVLLRELDVTLDDKRAPISRNALTRLRATLVGLSDADDAMLARRGQFGTEVRVRHLVGLDPPRGGVAVADHVQVGQQLAFCQRDVQAARRDLVRICAELRDELTPEEAWLPAARQIAGAVYVSCNGRGGRHFGGPSAELEILRHALGDVPLVGFFAAGEIAHRHLYGYTGVLTVFTR